MTSINRRVFILSLHAVVLSIVLGFQACSRTYKVELQQVGLPAKCEEGICQVGELSLSTDSVRPPAKILFVVDNSSTMKLSQQYLGEGVKSLVNDLKGFDADFFIYSTSDKHSQKWSFEKGMMVDRNDKPVLGSSFNSCQWNEIVNGSPVLQPTSSVCPKNHPISYFSETAMSLTPHLAIGADGQGLGFRGSDKEDRLESIRQGLASAIRSVGTDGTSVETGLCTMVRSVYNQEANKIFQKGDNAAIVILSDEDDSSSPANCVSRETKVESFVGVPPQVLPCDPAKEVCDRADYRVDYAQGYLPYSKVTADYSCQEEQSDSRVAGSGGFSKVTYTFNPLVSQISYRCQESVDYTLNFNPKNREVKYQCYSNFPSYSIKFNPQNIYAKNLGYECESLDDGVVVDASGPLVKINYLINQSQCESASLSACSAADVAAAQALCPMGTRLKSNSCQLTCVTSTKAVADQTYEDAVTESYQRDLSKDSFALASGTYANLSDWASKQPQNAQYTVKEVIRNSPTMGTVSTKPLPFTQTCASGVSSWMACDGAQGQAEATKYCGSKPVVSGSCYVRCNGSTAVPAAVVFKDSIKTADERNLSDEAVPFIHPSTKVAYSNLKAWANEYYYPSTISSIIAPSGPTYGNVISKAITENCGTLDETGAACAAPSLALTTATNGCGTNKKTSNCLQKCTKSSAATSFSLSDPASDTVNFCTAPTGGVDSFKVGSSNTIYTSVEDYAAKTINPTQAMKAKVALGSCQRAAWSYQSKPSKLTVAVNALTRCPAVEAGYDYSQYFSNLCQSTSPKQNGLSPNLAISYSCTNQDPSTNSNLMRADPALPDLPPIPSNGIPVRYDSVTGSMINVCNAPFESMGVTYANLKAWVAQSPVANGRKDEPQCSVFKYYKTVDSKQVLSDPEKPVVTQKWTFPKTMQVEDSQANLATAFVNQSEDLFGSNGYFVSAIVRDEKAEAGITGCLALGADQSYGTKYRSLVESVNSKSKGVKGIVASICESDYSRALSSVSDWIKQIARRTVFVPEVVGQDMEILSVWLYDPKTKDEKVLFIGKDYEVAGNKVNFINPSIDIEGKLVRYVYYAPKPK